MRTIEIFDTTLRDGEQSPGAAMTPVARLRIARMLDEAHVDTIEAGFPAANPVAAQSVASIARVAKRARVAALARCLRTDIDVAAAAVKDAKRPRIHVFLASSDLHLQRKLNISRERALEIVADGVSYARQFTDDVEFSAEDATRADRAFLARIFDVAIASGATTVNVPDTVGYTTPFEMGDLITYLREHVPDIGSVTISVHTHNDLGMATANALAAVKAGAGQVECTINGIGERAGNAALEEVVCALHVRTDKFDARTSFKRERIAGLSRRVSLATRMKVQKNKAIVGANAFAHESGIHQDGVLKERTTYEILDPASVGAKSSLTLGRNSGRHAVLHRAKSLGIAFDNGAFEHFNRAFEDFARYNTTVTDADLLRLARQVSV